MILAALGVLLPIAGETGTIGFQEFHLGQTIEEARTATLPSNVALYCSSDTLPAEFPTRWFNAKPDQAKDGLVHCLTGNWVAGMFAPAGLPVTDAAEARVDLYYLDGRLVEIETKYNFIHTLTIGAALRSKFGKPETEEIGSVENGYGARSEQLITTWKKGSATVQLRSPDYTRNLMSVTYRNPAASRFWGRLRSTGADDANL